MHKIVAMQDEDSKRPVTLLAIFARQAPPATGAWAARGGADLVRFVFYTHKQLFLACKSGAQAAMSEGKMLVPHWHNSCA